LLALAWWGKALFATRSPEAERVQPVVGLPRVRARVRVRVRARARLRASVRVGQGQGRV
jgi:hypothetical protein